MAPTIPFAPPPDATGLPIIGRPFTVISWFDVALVTCNCSDHPQPLLIVGDTQMPCPKCGEVWVKAGVVRNPGEPPQVIMGKVQQTAIAPAPPGFVPSTH